MRRASRVSLVAEASLSDTTSSGTSSSISLSASPARSEKVCFGASEPSLASASLSELLSFFCACGCGYRTTSGEGEGARPMRGFCGVGDIEDSREVKESCCASSRTRQVSERPHLVSLFLSIFAVLPVQIPVFCLCIQSSVTLKARSANRSRKVDRETYLANDLPRMSSEVTLAFTVSRRSLVTDKSGSGYAVFYRQGVRERSCDTLFGPSLVGGPRQPRSNTTGAWNEEHQDLLFREMSRRTKYLSRRRTLELGSSNDGTQVCCPSISTHVHPPPPLRPD